MTQQDYNNQEALRRPEISDVTKVAINRRRIVTISKRTVQNSLLIMKDANQGHIYETANRWAERSTHWAQQSDFLSPVVESVQNPVETDEEKMNKEIELSKRPPSTAELGLYLDGLNAPEGDDLNEIGVTPVNDMVAQGNVVQLAEARALVDEIRSREAA